MATLKLGRHCHRTAIAIIAGMSLNLGLALADEPAFDSPAAAIADGQPWTMHGADGNELRLTLYDDGTGRIEGGLVPLTPTWRATADGFCMTPNLFIGERCVMLERAKDGYIARRQDGIAFSLTR